MSEIMGDKENRGNQCANILPHLKDEKNENVNMQGH
jgi:hypothetical protein